MELVHCQQNKKSMNSAVIIRRFCVGVMLVNKVKQERLRMIIQPKIFTHRVGMSLICKNEI